jgi:hypothetical protein
MKIRQIYLQGKMIDIRNSRLVSFWLDPWMDNTPSPFVKCTMSYMNCPLTRKFDVMERGWVVQFRIRLRGIIRAQWYERASRLNEVSLSSEKDVVL